jgi:hypothetical protein
MYVTQTQACGVQNSAMQPPAAWVARQRAEYASMMQAMDAAQSAFSRAVYCRTPAQFADLGAQIAGDVGNSPVSAPGTMVTSATATTAAAPAATASTSAGAGSGSSLGQSAANSDSGCSCEFAGPEIEPYNTGAPIPVPPTLSLSVTGPTAFPARAVQPPAQVEAAPAQAVRTPTWGNICYAMRWGQFDYSQVDPVQYRKANQKCASLGYGGACPAPYNTQVYLQRGRAAGSLPHIDLPDSMIDNLPPAPSNPVPCNGDGQKTAGISGLGARRRGRRRGVGDYVCASPSAVVSTSSSSVSSAVGWAKQNPLWLLGGAAVVLAMLGSGEKGASF